MPPYEFCIKCVRLPEISADMMREFPRVGLCAICLDGDKFKMKESEKGDEDETS